MLCSYDLGCFVQFFGRPVQMRSYFVFVATLIELGCGKGGQNDQDGIKATNLTKNRLQFLCRMLNNASIEIELEFQRYSSEVVHDQVEISATCCLYELSASICYARE